MNRNLIFVSIVWLGISFSLFACSTGIKGSGVVTRQERPVDPFESISVSAGLELVLRQDSALKVVVEADDNLQDIIKTEVSGGKLKIFPEKMIGAATAKRVIVSFKDINVLKASSGAQVNGQSELNLLSLKLSASSGALIDLSINANECDVDGSSGANVRIKGGVVQLGVDGSSGANINIHDFIAKNCNASASSGANLKISVSDKINAKASSGGQIDVSGNQKEREVERSSGGNVSFN